MSTRTGESFCYFPDSFCNCLVVRRPKTCARRTIALGSTGITPPSVRLQLRPVMATISGCVMPHALGLTAATSRAGF
jgi:hypothetical protein